jgi:pimeloyl-ACP methyl ester carboxylesterase
LAAILHAPHEVDGLRAICDFAPRPPEKPIASVYRALADPTLDLEEWAAYLRDREAEQSELAAQSIVLDDRGKNEIAVEPPDYFEAASTLQKLRLTLELAQELWEAQGAESSQLMLILLLAQPEDGEANVTLDGDGVALAIKPGSLFGEVVRLPLRATSFALCFMCGGGTSTTARRADMLERLRKDAADAGKPPLMDIRQLKPLPAAPLMGRGLLVLIHGLFATDIGTFGALEKRLTPHFQVVGFPHDTLSQSIEANAFELAQRLSALGYPQVRFVAHSRGGLVARSTAVLLAKHFPAVVPKSCATFGTPHLGAELAENAGALIATAALLKAGVADRSIASVLDMLCCYSELGAFPGISDLRPASTKENWLARLQNEEGLHADAKMELCVVGGATQPAGRMQRLAASTVRRVIGNKPSDLVVAQTSSIPPLSRGGPCYQVHCNHFSYFGEDQAATLDQVVAFLLRP